MPHVTDIHLHEVETEHPRRVDDVAIASTGGIEGDSHSNEPRVNRRVLVTSLEVLASEGLGPGDLREQITVSGMDVNSLVPGSVITVGDHTAEVMGECAPCLVIGKYLGKDDVEEFRDRLQGKRGVFVLFKGVEPGARIKVGDAVAEVSPKEAERVRFLDVGQRDLRPRHNLQDQPTN